MAFLYAEYRMLSMFIIAVAAILFFGGEDNGLGMHTMIAFIIGALCSVAAVFSACVPQPVQMVERLRLLLTVSLNHPRVLNPRSTPQERSSNGTRNFLQRRCSHGPCSWWIGTAWNFTMYYFTQTEFLTVENIAGFGMGASSIALFARVGGGIYTKAADVGAISSVRSKQVFLKMTLATPVSLPTTWVTMLVTLQAWAPIFSSHS